MAFNVMDRFVMPLIHESKGALCIDFQYDAYGRKTFTTIRRDYKWLERHTKPTSNESVYKESDLKKSYIISYIFKELHDL